MTDWQAWAESTVASVKRHAERGDDSLASIVERDAYATLLVRVANGATGLERPARTLLAIRMIDFDRGEP